MTKALSFTALGINITGKFPTHDKRIRIASYNSQESLKVVRFLQNVNSILQKHYIALYRLPKPTRVQIVENKEATNSLGF